jgi:hypothetical protein
MLREELTRWVAAGSPLDNVPDVRIEFVTPDENRSVGADHPGVLNLPVASQIAMIIPDHGACTLHSSWRRFVTYLVANGRSKTIKETHQSFFSLRFPLLFPYGTSGWAPWTVRLRLAPRAPEHVDTPGPSESDSDGDSSVRAVRAQRRIHSDSDDDSNVVVSVALVYMYTYKHVNVHYYGA